MIVQQHAYKSGTDQYIVNFDELLKRNQALENSNSTLKLSPRATGGSHLAVDYPSTMIFDENESALGIGLSSRPSKQGAYQNYY